MAIIIGIRYVVINSIAGNNGKIVTVTGYAGAERLDGCCRGDRWYVDDWLPTNIPRFRINHVGQNCLKPYHDGNEPITWEAMKDIWTPESIEA